MRKWGVEERGSEGTENEEKRVIKKRKERNRRNKRRGVGWGEELRDEKGTKGRGNKS